MYLLISLLASNRGKILSEVFMEVIPRRELPDYYRVIKSPIAIQTVQVSSQWCRYRGIGIDSPPQNKIRRKMYTNFKDFITDAARVSGKHLRTESRKWWVDVLTDRSFTMRKPTTGPR